MSERPTSSPGPSRANPAVFWDWDPDSDTLTWSGRVEALVSTLGGAPCPNRLAWDASIHPGDVARVRAGLDQLLAGTSSRSGASYRVRSASGHWVDAVDCAFAIRQPEQERPMIIGTLRFGPPTVPAAPVTDERGIEAPGPSADHLPLLLWEMDEHGWTYACNQRWYEFTGMSPAAVEGWGWVAAHDPQDLPRLLRSLRQALSAGEPWEEECRVRRADGAARWHLSRVIPVGDGERRIVRWLGTSIDIHDLKVALLERDRQLVVEQVLRRDAEMATRQKDEFLAMVSHELRSPLNAVLGWSQMLKAGFIGAEQRASALDKIDSNGRLLGRLIEDLLDVSRIVTGRLQVVKVPLDMAVAVRRAIEAVRPEADNKAMTIRFEPPAVPLPLAGSMERLQQIMSNLLTNAVKFSPPGETVDVAAVLDDGAIVVTVKDYGEGINPAFLPMLFDRFSQADPSNPRRRGGLGLGLSIARYLVELHGGSIAAESGGPGHGATFVIRLPALLEAAPALRDQAAELPRPPQPPVSLKGITVLAVDDEPDARELVASVLLACGATVRVVSTVGEVFEALQADRPDVIVSDISMPQWDGHALVQRLRGSADPRLSRMPVLALTAAATPQDRTRALREGFSNYLTKPFEPNHLASAILDLARARFVKP